jgi:site-specific DNA-cytosine methylase
MLRRKAKAARFVKWHEESPVMWDVCVKSKPHVHLVDKWDFVAFAVGGEEGVMPLEVWRQRRELADDGGRKRKRCDPALWRQKVQRQKFKVQRQRQAAGREGGGVGPVEREEEEEEEGMVTDFGSAVPKGQSVLPFPHPVSSPIPQPVRGREKLRVLSLFHGSGAFSLAVRKWKVQADVEIVAVELDPVCRRFTACRFPEEEQGWSGDVRDWAGDGFDPTQCGVRFWFDLVVGGFPCVDVSGANAGGKGLKGQRSALVFDMWKVICKCRQVNPACDFMMECVDFSVKHRADFDMVSTMVGVKPVVLCASRIAACRRKRAFWCSFEVGELVRVHVEPASVLEPGRWTDDAKLPTLVASGTKSWNTAKVVHDDAVGGDGLGPLTVLEMERCMGMPEGFVNMPGLTLTEKHRLIGNAFHVGVAAHIYRAWLLRMCDFDPTLGYPGEGPTEDEARKRARAYDVLEDQKWNGWGPRPRKKARGSVGIRRVTPGERVAVAVAAPGVARERPSAGAISVGARPGLQLEREAQPRRAGQSQQGRRQPRWRQHLPAEGRAGGVAPVSLQGMFAEHGWGSTQRELLPVRAGSGPRLEVPEGHTALAQFARKVAHDLVLSSRSDSTWKHYRAWIGVFQAWLRTFGVSSEPGGNDEALWEQWVQVLIVEVAVLSQCYALGTVAIAVTAVATYMQDHGMRSPHESRLFNLVMKGLTRHMGVGVAKKPPVEPGHVAKILSLPAPDHWTPLMHLQGLAVLLVGWELFNRSEDFAEFQICDFREIPEGLMVLIRYAKNDQKGVTRTPVLERAGDARVCPVRAFQRYRVAALIEVHPGCTKVVGEPHRCTVCPPAFPSITRTQGKKSMAMPKSRVTDIVKALYGQLAAHGHMELEVARGYSSKSLRCGGRSVAAANAIRGGVICGHGGWLHKQSADHYERMLTGEATQVSRALNTAVARFLEPGGVRGHVENLDGGCWQ